VPMLAFLTMVLAVGDARLRSGYSAALNGKMEPAADQESRDGLGARNAIEPGGSEPLSLVALSGCSCAVREKAFWKEAQSDSNVLSKATSI